MPMIGDDPKQARPSLGVLALGETLSDSRRSLARQFLHGAAHQLLSIRIKSALDQRQKAAVLIQKMPAHPLDVTPAGLHHGFAALATLGETLEAIEKRLFHFFTSITRFTHALDCRRYALDVLLQRGIKNLFLLFQMRVERPGNLQAKLFQTFKGLSCVAGYG